MFKYLLIPMLTYGILNAGNTETCENWLLKHKPMIAGAVGKGNAAVVLDKNGEIDQVYAAGYGGYDFNDFDDKKMARDEAVLNAKINLSNYLKQIIKQRATIDNISKKNKELTQTSKKVSLDTVKTMVNNLTSNTESVLQGVIGVCENHNVQDKTYTIIVAQSKRTINGAMSYRNIQNTNNSKNFGSGSNSSNINKATNLNF